MRLFLKGLGENEFVLLERHDGFGRVAVVWSADHYWVEIVGCLVEHLAVVLIGAVRFPLFSQQVVFVGFVLCDSFVVVGVATGICIAIRAADIAVAYGGVDVAFANPSVADEGDA